MSEGGRRPLRAVVPGAAVAASVVGGLIAQLLAGVLVARALAAPAELGLYSASVVAGNLVGALVGLGVDRLLPVLVAQANSREDAMAWFDAQTRLIPARAGLAVGGAALWSVAMGGSGPAALLCLATALGALLVQARVDVAFALERRLLGAGLSLGQRGGLLLLVICVGLAVRADARLVVLSVALFVLHVVIGALGHRALRAAQVRRQRRSVTELLRRSRPYVLLPLAAFVYVQGDTLVLAALRPLDDVAHYRVAWVIASASVIGYHIVQTWLFPRFARAAGEGGATWTEVSSRFHRWAFGTVVAGIVFATWLHEPFLDRVLPTYRASAAFVPVLLLGYLAYYAPPYGDMFHVLGRPEVISRTAVATGLLNVALNLAWVPAHGAAGAAWATVVSFGALRCMYVLAVRRTGAGWTDRRTLMALVLLGAIALATVVGASVG